MSPSRVRFVAFDFKQCVFQLLKRADEVRFDSGRLSAVHSEPILSSQPKFV